MLISLFPRAADAQPRSVEVSWGDLVASLQPQATHETDKRNIPAWSPAEFDGSRANAHAVRVSLGVVDLDSLTEAQMAATLKATAGTHRLLYSTFSHGTKPGIRARLVARLTRPVEAREWQSWIAALHRWCPNADGTACDISRIYFGAWCPPSALSEAFAVELPGAPLDVDGLLSLARESRQPVNRDLLMACAAKARKASHPGVVRWARSLELLAAGEPFAAPGERDTTIFHVVRIVGSMVPDVDTDSLIEAFAPSLQTMAALNPETPTLAVVAEKVARVLGSSSDRVTSRIGEAFGSDRTHAYSQHEISTIAEQHGCAVSDLEHRWIVQRGGSYYCLFRDGYKGPFGEAEIPAATEQWLSPSPVVLRGPQGPKPLAQLMREYGTVAESVVLDMVSHRTTFDGRTIYEVGVTPRTLAPEYDSEVDTWLGLLGGARATELRTWLALVTALDRPIVALLLTGAKAAGKSLLAHGLARIWTTDNPTMIGNALGKWGDALLRCPIVFADECIPEGITTEQIREFVQSRQRPVDRKFLPTATLRGASRLIVAANAPDVITLDEDLTDHDLQAIAERFLYVDVSEAAAQYLAAIDAETFVTRDRLARHALWLRDHHPHTAKGRFAIPTDGELLRTLVNTVGIRARVLEWAALWVQHRDRVPDAGALVRDGMPWISARALTQFWGVFHGRNTPSSDKISRALRAVSVARDADGRRAISREALRAWCEGTEQAQWEIVATALALGATSGNIMGA